MQEQFKYDKEDPMCEVCNKNDKAEYSSMCQKCIDSGWRIKDIFVEPYEYEKIEKKKSATNPLMKVRRIR